MTKKILLVEDEALIALYEAQILEKHNYSVITVHNAKAAIENALNDYEINLVLMDIDLGSGMDGTEAAEAILKERDLPIVFLSSHTEPEVVQKTEGITSYGYIVKNSGETVLVASIKMAFRLFEAKMNEERSKTELLHSRDLMRYIIEHSQSAIAVHDKQLNYIYVSRQYLNQYNVEERDVIGKHHYEVFPDLPHKWREVHKKALQGEVSRGEDDPFEREDGTVDWTRWECRPWYTADGSIGGIIVYTEVITKEKKIGATVRETINYLQSILRTTQDGFWVVDMQGNFIDVNPAYCQMSGYTREEFLQLHIQDIDADEKPRESGERIRRIIRQGGEVFQVRHRRKDGSEFDAEVSASFLGGEQEKIICFCRDISDRMRAERELREREENLRTTLNSIGDAVISTDVQGRIVRMNPVAEKLCGWSVSSAYNRPLEEVFNIVNALTREKMSNPVSKVLANGKIVGLANHTLLLSRDGPEYQIADSAAPIIDDQHNIVGVVLVFRDVTEQYRKNQRLHESLQWYRSLFDESPLGIFHYDCNGTITECNQKFVELIGSRKKDLVGFNLLNSLRNDDFKAEVGVSLYAGQGFYEGEYTSVTGGKTSNLRIFLKGIRDENDKIYAGIGMVEDITQSTQTFEELQEMYHRLQSIVDHSPFIINEIGPEGHYILVNESTVQLLGRSKQDLIGKHFSEVLPPETARLFEQRVRQVYESAEQLIVDDTLQLDGSKRVYRTVLFPLFHNQVSIRSIVGIGYDVTHEVRSREEKDFFMRELNHRIKNNLNLLSSLIGLKEAESDEDLSDIFHQIKAIQIVHEKLQAAENMTEVNAREYLEELVNTVFNSFTHHTVKIESDIEEVVIPTRAAIPLGLLVNEIATNAIKHGFSAGTQARFTIILKKSSSGEEYQLILTNTGNSFPEQISIENPTSLGLQLIGTLTDQLNGTVELIRRPNTTFNIRFPAYNLLPSDYTENEGVQGKITGMD